nr:hypothetical protein Iba_chr15dCG8480 [Ipomoea batatas]
MTPELAKSTGESVTVVLASPVLATDAGEMEGRPRARRLHTADRRRKEKTQTGPMEEIHCRKGGGSAHRRIVHPSSSERNTINRLHMLVNNTNIVVGQKLAEKGAIDAATNAVRYTDRRGMTPELQVNRGSGNGGLLRQSLLRRRRKWKVAKSSPLHTADRRRRRPRFPTVGELSPKLLLVDGKGIVQPGSEVRCCGVLQFVESHLGPQVIDRKGIFLAESRETDDFISPVVERSQDLKCHRDKSGLPYAEKMLPIRAPNERGEEGHQPVFRKHGVVKVQHRSNQLVLIESKVVHAAGGATQLGSPTPPDARNWNPHQLVEICVFE